MPLDEDFAASASPADSSSVWRLRARWR